MQTIDREIERGSQELSFTRENLQMIIDEINDDQGTNYKLDEEMLEGFRDYALGNRVEDVHEFYGEYRRYFLAFQGIDRFLRKSYIEFNRKV